VAETAVRTPFVTSGGRVEMEVDALLTRVGGVLSGLGDRRRHVAAVGIAGVAESGAPLDAGGRALAPVMAWHDPRGEEAVALLDRRFGPDLALRAGQTANTKMTVAKLGWLLTDGLRGLTRWLGVPELVLRALTGAEATEFSLAARTGCYDVVSRSWMPEVAEAVGVGIDVFPPVAPAGTAMGHVSPAGAAWSGLPEGIPVTIAGHDHLAGMAGAGVSLGELANSVGTAETLVGRMASPPDMVAARNHGVAVTVYPGGREWAVLVGAARAGLVIEAAAAALGRTPAELDQLAVDAEPVEIGNDAVNALAKGRPVDLPAAPPGPVWAGVLHALTLRTIRAYYRLAPVAGPVERVVVFGGGSASAPWVAAKTAAFPVPVMASDVTSAVARGAALYAGETAG
jgi:xylulokinase